MPQTNLQSAAEEAVLTPEPSHAAGARFSPSSPALRGLIAGLLATIFVIDLVTPMGLGDAVLFSVPVLLSVSLPHARETLLVAGISTALTVVGYFFSPVTVVSAGAIIFHRMLTVFIIWVIALLGLRYRAHHDAILNTAARLRESEDRFRVLAEMIPSMVWTAAPDGTITYANRRWLEYCGLSEKENAHRWPELVLHADDRERCLAQWQEHLRTGELYEIEVRNRRHDGVYRWFITRAVPWRYGDGPILAWFGVTTDIHDQKEFQEQLREAARQKDEFLAVLGHELRNPLAGILGGVQVLDKIDGQSAEAQEMQQVVLRQAQLMQRLLDDLLDVSRIARGKIILKSERLDLCELVRQVARDYAQPLKERNQSLSLEAPDEAIWCEGDRARLQQVVGNLLHNACKFTGDGGQITVRLSRDAAKKQAILQVIDTGIGMGSETLRLAFQPFAQADRTLARSGGGLGLGLAVVRGLAELHGGTAEAASAGREKGSTFTVRLPIAKEAVEAKAPVAPQAKEDVTRLRVLVIDDRRDASHPLTKLLQLAGHEVQVAVDGPGGIEAARRMKPHVVLCDIGLPGMDGYEVARRLRSDPEIGKTYLIAATGYGQQEDRRRAKEAGFDMHLVKPVDVRLLKPILSRIAAKKDKSRPRENGNGQRNRQAQKADLQK